MKYIQFINKQIAYRKIPIISPGTMGILAKFSQKFYTAYTIFT